MSVNSHHDDDDAAAYETASEESTEIDMDDMAAQYRAREYRSHVSDGDLAGHTSPCAGSSGVCTPEEPCGSPAPAPQRADSPPRKKRRTGGPTPASVLMEALKPAAEGVIEQAKPTAEQREDLALHNKARAFKPQQGLKGKNRFWIAVLNPGVRVANVRGMSDFIWMKGHGGTTVMTVWHHWKMQAAADADFKLQINDEFPAHTCTMAELDYYNDQHAVFRPVQQINIGE